MSSESRFLSGVKLIFGILTILQGSEIVRDPKVYSPIYRYTWDLTGYNVPFGMALIAVGVFFMWSAFFQKPKDPWAWGIQICPKCELTFRKDEVPSGKCPKCGEGLEALSGFYERHPELRGRKQ